MAIDYFTGILSSIFNKELCSRTGIEGIIRKLYYLLLIGAVYLLDLVVPGISYAGDGAAIALCVLEFISISENGVRMGLPIPNVIKNALAIVKETTGEGDQHDDKKN